MILDPRVYLFELQKIQIDTSMLDFIQHNSIDKEYRELLIRNTEKSKNKIDSIICEVIKSNEKYVTEEKELKALYKDM